MQQPPLQPPPTPRNSTCFRKQPTAAAAVVTAAEFALWTRRRCSHGACSKSMASRWSGDNVHLPNVAPDEGLSAPFNSWFTLFGQFFDHGLDLVNKGGSGTVFIPLQPDDPLYVEGSDTNFMVLTAPRWLAGRHPGRRRLSRQRGRRRHCRPSTRRPRSSTRTRPTRRIRRTRCSCASTCSTPPATRSRPAS